MLNRPTSHGDPIGLICTNMVFIGHSPNVAAGLSKLTPPSPCDAIGVITCGMNSIMANYNAKYPNHLVPDWPLYDDPNCTPFAAIPELWSKAVTAIWKAYAIQCGCKCGCSKAWTVVKCDHDANAAISGYVTGGVMAYNPCGKTYYTDCKASPQGIDPIRTPAPLSGGTGPRSAGAS